jgi:predicted nucleotidyltransferase component of viral defense system
VIGVIDKTEIFKIQKVFGLQPTIIEKDYVLGWVLMGIQRQPEIHENWIFKGGTCLKKCFFDKYRFSEDLDFSLTTDAFIHDGVLKRILKDLCDWVYTYSGIEFPIDIYKNPHGIIAAELKLTYFGPLRQKTNFPRIKMDITAHEKVVLPAEKRSMFHQYSDKPQGPQQIVCYCYEEIFAEKIRALGERARLRDLYDVVHLFAERHHWLSNKKRFLQCLSEKCEFKHIPLVTLDLIERHPQRAILSTEWHNMLRHQLPELKPFEYFWAKLPEIFAWIQEENVI